MESKTKQEKIKRYNDIKIDLNCNQDMEHNILIHKQVNFIKLNYYLQYIK